MPSHPSIIVSEDALFRRCKRALYRTDRLFLCRCREDSRWLSDLGRYYCVDERNHIGGPWIRSLEELGRELGVLRENERLAE